jgi:hypothetical protein
LRICRAGQLLQQFGGLSDVPDGKMFEMTSVEKQKKIRFRIFHHILITPVKASPVKIFTVVINSVLL